MKNIATNYENELAARELARQEQIRVSELSAFRAEQARLIERNRTTATALHEVSAVTMSDKLMEEFKQLVENKSGLYVDDNVKGLELNTWIIQDKHNEALGLVEGNKLYSNNSEVKTIVAMAEINIIKQLTPEKFAVDEFNQALSNSGYSADSRGFIRDWQNSRVAWLGEQNSRGLQEVFIFKSAKFEPLRQELSNVHELKQEITRKQSRGFGMEM